ncbi:MAG: nickel-responsive transcriptional regulator NikR [Opitutae bacterium]|nr:nickel-responsive transcriptional regulator NikR [Opitutae bacterium]
MGQMALRILLQDAAEGVPRGVETFGGALEGLGAFDEGGMEGGGGAALRAVGAEIEAADAAIGGEGNPERFVGLWRAEGGPFLVEPFADGEFVLDGVLAAARGVEEPFVGVLDAHFWIGGGLREEKVRIGIGRGGEEEKEGQRQETHGTSVAGGPSGRQIFLEKTVFCAIITKMKNRNNDLEDGAARLSLSLPNGLAAELDRLVAEKGAASRSALVADLVREAVVEHRSRRGKQEIAGAITLVYDHHARNLQAKLTDLQHDAESLIVSVMHVHLSHHDCLETLVVRGPADKVRTLADRLAAVRGVKHGKLTITTTGHEE